MTEQWYYAKNGQQLGPVGTEVLMRLASSGQVQPTDLVWKEGMANWAPARTVRAIFPEPAPAAVVVPAVVQPPTGAQHPYGLSPEPVAVPTSPHPAQQEWRAEEPEEGDWDRPRRRRRRQRSGNPVLAIVGISVGVLLAIGAVILLVVLLQPGNPRSWSLRTNEKYTCEVEFKKGQNVEIWVTSDHDSDVDLFVYDPRGATVPGGVDDGFSKDCHVQFTAPQTGRYKIVVWNRLLDPRMGAHRNRSNSGTLKWEAK
jgi:hypothetical protein